MAAFMGGEATKVFGRTYQINLTPDSKFTPRSEQDRFGVELDDFEGDIVLEGRQVTDGPLVRSNLNRKSEKLNS